MSKHEMPLLSRRPPPDDNIGERRLPHLWEIQAVTDLFVLLAAGLALWFVYELRGVFMPVLTALGLAYLVHPLITQAQVRWRIPRMVSISILLVLFAVGTAAFFAWLGPLLVHQIQSLAQKAPQYIQTIGGRYGIELTGMSDQVIAWTSRFQEDPLAAIEPIFAGTGHALGIIGAVIGTTTYIAMTTLLIPIYFFVFAWRFDRMTEVLIRLIPASQRVSALEILCKMDEAVTGFFRGRLLIAVITGILYAAGWAFTDVPYWFLLGAGTGILSIIPYVSVIGWPIAILLKYLDVLAGAETQAVDWLSIAVWPSVPYLIVQFLESWWLTPWIEGRTTNLSSITVIIVVLVGGAIGGFLGLLLAIPVAASLKILMQELLLPRWEAWAARR
jgi:predicted PurR-regulated permease PerM